MPDRRPRLGYLLAASAATMWAFNGSLARYLLDDGVSAERLSQLRSTVSFVLLVAVLAVVDPDKLRVPKRALPKLAFLGIVGLAGVHATYFIAIEHLQIGVALTIQYLGPILLLVWLAVVHRRKLAGSLWAASGLALLGCALVVRVYAPGDIDTTGLLAALGAATTFAIYLVAAERAGQSLHPTTTLTYAFGFATIFWLIVQPPWSFPYDEFHSVRNISLGLGVAVVGTLVPFVFMVTALQHLPAPRAAVIATLEPVLAALIAWPVHGESLSAVQLVGGVLVVAAVAWIQSHPIVHAQETTTLEQASTPAPPSSALHA
jgi:drug/metabolite transporter (DMT)-like permease